MRTLKLELGTSETDKPTVQFKTLFASEYRNENRQMTIRVSDPITKENGEEKPVELGAQPHLFVLNHDDILALHSFFGFVIELNNNGMEYERNRNICSSLGNIS